jgi:hypothetical protein
MQMVSSQASTFWSTVMSMVAANTLIALGAAAISQLSGSTLPLAIGALFGIGICATWFFMVKRQFAYFAYWISFARDLEPQVLPDTPQLLSLGDAYGKGSQITLPGGQYMRMPWPARIWTIQNLVVGMVALFAALFIVLMFVALFAHSARSATKQVVRSVL